MKIPATVGERLKNLVEIGADDDCWPWRGYVNPHGYGTYTFLHKGRRTGGMAHRRVYEVMAGEIPEGLTLDHLCRNRVCCNPAHLEPVTLAENIRRAPKRNRNYQQDKTSCPHGHPYDQENTLWVKGGTERRCRACNKAWRKKWQAKRAAA